MNKLFGLICLLALLGCKPNPRVKAIQDYYCSDKGGVYTYVVGYLEIGYCNDNTRFELSNIDNSVLPDSYYPNIPH